MVQEFLGLGRRGSPFGFLFDETNHTKTSNPPSQTHPFASTSPIHPTQPSPPPPTNQFSTPYQNQPQSTPLSKDKIYNLGAMTIVPIFPSHSVADLPKLAFIQSLLTTPHADRSVAMDQLVINLTQHNFTLADFFTPLNFPPFYNTPTLIAMAWELNPIIFELVLKTIDQLLTQMLLSSSSPTTTLPTLDTTIVIDAISIANWSNPNCTRMLFDAGFKVHVKSCNLVRRLKGYDSKNNTYVALDFPSRPL